MNAKYLSGGKRSKEAIDVQQTTQAQEIYRPSPGSKLNLNGWDYLIHSILDNPHLDYLDFLRASISN